jgi:hypothetical protein
MKTLEIVSGLVSIRSNVNRIPGFSFAQNLPPSAPQKKGQGCLVEVDFQVYQDIESGSILPCKYHDFYGRKNYDEIFYKRRIGGPEYAKLNIKEINNHPEISSNTSYSRWIRTIVRNLYPPGVHLTDIVTIKLLQNKYLPIHTAGFSVNGFATILMAPQNTGKTYTIMNIMKAMNNEARYISEDIGVTDGEFMYGCPWTSTYNELGIRSWDRILNIIKQYLPIFSPFLIPRMNIKKFGFKESEGKAKINKIFIMQISDENSIDRIPPEKSFRLMMNLNRYEFHYWRNPLLMAYEYFNDSFNFSEFSEIETSIIKYLAQRFPVYFVTAKNPTEFAPLIMAEV